MAEIEIKRGYEVLPDNRVRFGIRVINNGDFAISDVEVILDYSHSLFELEGSKIEGLGNIPPSISRTAKFTLKPLSCVHKEEIEATILFRDHKWEKHTFPMRPKEIHCVCPFLKEKSITRADFLKLFNEGYSAEHGVNFENISPGKLVEFLSHTCKNRLYKVDEFSIENGTVLYLSGESLGEKAYYLLTAIVIEREGIVQVFLHVSSDKPFGIHGFLNEILENLRHLVCNVSAAREIGIIKNEQVINIIDSVVQHTNFSGGTDPPSVNIHDSVVQRTNFGSPEEENRKREVEEKLRRQQEEESRLKKTEEERLRRIKEEEEKHRQKEIEEKERLNKQQEEADRRKREQERQQPEELERRNVEKAAKAPASQQTFQHPSQQTVSPEKPPSSSPITKPPGFPGIKILVFGIIFSILLIGAAVTFLSSSSNSAQNISSSQTDYTNSIGMEFVEIPAGEFMMGSSSVHKVTINESFYMGKFEVTQEQWREVMGDNPSYHKGDDLPVEDVSWYDAQEFIEKLNEMEGTDKYRLPSEAEWEYACRAGTTTIYYFGDDESELGDYAWYANNSKGFLHLKAHPVGQKKPNPWGLYDMYGNVEEWCQDRYHRDYDGAPSNGSAWEEDWISPYGVNSYRVVRGGGWDGIALYCWSAYHTGSYSDSRLFNTGFRVLRKL